MQHARTDQQSNQSIDPTARSHQTLTAGRQAAALAPSALSSKRRAAPTMLLAGGSGVEDLVATDLVEPQVAAAASVAFWGSLLNLAEEVRGFGGPGFGVGRWGWEVGG